MTAAPRLDLPREINPSSPWCQRWTAGHHSWRHRSDGGFDPARYTVEPADEATAKAYVVENHYSASYPAATKRWALRTQDHRRFVLDQDVPANGESWFLARVWEQAAAGGIRGVVTFADPVPRVVNGTVLFAGHIGTIYQASNAAYTGRGTPRTLTVLPDGHILPARAAQKVRAGERGHDHVEARLVTLGARRRQPATPGATWLAQALKDVGAVNLRHPGNHRYAFRLGVTPRARAAVEITPTSRPYPKNRSTP